MENEKNIVCLSKGKKKFGCKCGSDDDDEEDLVLCSKCDYVLIYICCNLDFNAIFYTISVQKLLGRKLAC